MIPDYTEVERILEEQIAPMLLAHQGGIRLKSISPNGEVRVSFQGNCTHCPMLEDTLSNSVEVALQDAFPKASIKVVAVNDVDDDLWAMAKHILRKEP